MKAVSSALCITLFSVLLLAGCGQKGPLYLPGDAPESQTDGPFGIDEDNDGADNEAADSHDRTSTSESQTDTGTR